MLVCIHEKQGSVYFSVDVPRSAIPSNDPERFWGDADNDKCPSFWQSGRFTVNNVTWSTLTGLIKANLSQRTVWTPVSTLLSRCTLGWSGFCCSVVYVHWVCPCAVESRARWRPSSPFQFIYVQSPCDESTRQRWPLLYTQLQLSPSNSSLNLISNLSL